MEYTVGTKVFGEWEICRTIGAGSFGEVYEIRKRDHGIEAVSAMKVIKIPKSQSDVQSVLNEGMDRASATAYFQGVVDDFVREIAIMSELKGHPNIVHYEDHAVIAQENGIGSDVLIRMELLRPISDWITQNGLNERELYRLARDIAGALSACEQKHLLHRDIKPENIFVARGGTYKLGDFGISRTADRTTGGMSKQGTEAYMAPEVYKGKNYGSSVDIYSLGLVLYRLANKNRLPFYPLPPEPIRYTDREEAMKRRMSGEAMPAPSDADSRLSGIILKCCEYESNNRYRNARELLNDLEGFGGDDQVQYAVRGEGVQSCITGDGNKAAEERKASEEEAYYTECLYGKERENRREAERQARQREQTERLSALKGRIDRAESEEDLEDIARSLEILFKDGCEEARLTLETCTRKREGMERARTDREELLKKQKEKRAERKERKKRIWMAVGIAAGVLVAAYLLTGAIVCHNCGRPMFMQSFCENCGEKNFGLIPDLIRYR